MLTVRHVKDAPASRPLQATQVQFVRERQKAVIEKPRQGLPFSPIARLRLATPPQTAVRQIVIWAERLACLARQRPAKTPSLPPTVAHMDTRAKFSRATRAWRLAEEEKAKKDGPL